MFRSHVCRVTPKRQAGDRNDEGPAFGIGVAPRDERIFLFRTMGRMMRSTLSAASGQDASRAVAVLVMWARTSPRDETDARRAEICAERLAQMFEA